MKLISFSRLHGVLRTPITIFLLLPSKAVSLLRHFGRLSHLFRHWRICFWGLIAANWKVIFEGSGINESKCQAFFVPLGALSSRFRLHLVCLVLKDCCSYKLLIFLVPEVLCCTLTPVNSKIFSLNSRLSSFIHLSLPHPLPFFH